MIDSALVIAPEWIDKILAGEKTWEIRSEPNARVGRIALAKKGGPLVATCIIGKSIPLEAKDFSAHFEKHRVRPEELRAYYGDRDVYAWPLSDVRSMRFLDEVVTPDVFTAAHTLRNRNSFTRNDGTPHSYTLINICDSCKSTSRCPDL